MKRKQHDIERTKQEIEVKRQELDQKIADFNASATDSTDSDSLSETEPEASHLEGLLAKALSELESTKAALAETQSRLEQGPGKGPMSFAEVFAVDESQVKEDIWRMIGDVRFDVKNATAVLYARQPATARGLRTAR